MTDINAPYVSDFERRELLRAAQREAPWSRQPSESGERAVYEGRFPNTPEWAFKAYFDIESESDGPLMALEIFPATLSPPKEGLTHAVYKSLTFEWLRTDLRSWLGMNPPEVEEAVELGGLALRPGRAGQNPVFYAEWARRYVDALDATSRPLADLARRWSLSEGAIRGYLHEARRRGLLTEPPPGKAGGRLTVEALKLLASEYQEQRNRTRTTSKRGKR